MGWFDQSDNYCERLDLTFWSEPLNAVTNASFLIAAYIMWRRTRGANLILADILCIVLACIGIGSFLFHTFATNWAALADVAPIGIFILVYLYAVNLHVIGWHGPGSFVGTLAFAPYAFIMVPLFDALPFFRISDFYWTVPLLLVLYYPFVRPKYPETARGMLIGAGILATSITLRSLDMPLCDAFPIGTHIFWHILNGVMLGWMIEVYRRHMVARQAS